MHNTSNTNQSKEPLILSLTEPSTQNRCLMTHRKNIGFVVFFSKQIPYAFVRII